MHAVAVLSHPRVTKQEFDCCSCNFFRCITVVAMQIVACHVIQMCSSKNVIAAGVLLLQGQGEASQ